MTVRVHGKKPYRAAVVHGGPGAIGSAAGLAKGLAEYCGVMEPLQSEYTVNGQVEELKGQITSFNGGSPLVLIGHSWGAWLCAMTAAKYPELASKLILVDSGPLTEQHVPQIEMRRLSHFTDGEKKRYHTLLAELEQKDSAAKDRLLEQLGALCEKADTYRETALPGDAVTLDGEMYSRVFPEAAEIRKTGQLLRLFDRIQCPLCIIHGEYDTPAGRSDRSALGQTDRLSFSSAFQMRAYTVEGRICAGTFLQDSQTGNPRRAQLIHVFFTVYRQVFRGQ